MEPEGLVFDIKRYAIHDGPGIRTTVFLKGCPLKCPWCHNPEGIAGERQLVWRADRCIGCRACCDVCPEDAIAFAGDTQILDRARCTLCGSCVDVCFPQALEMIGAAKTVSEVMAEIEKDLVFYDQSNGGVTFSGGEPLAQPDFVAGVLGVCKAQGIHTVVDTNGHIEPGVLDRICEEVDLFLWDLKMMDNELHSRYTGVSNSLILENLVKLSHRGKRIILRLSLVPGVNDDDRSIDHIGEFARSLDSIERLDILPYHRAGLEKARRLDPEIEPFTRRPLSAGAVLAVRDRLSRYGLKVRVGG
jgi:pyruvate formate lyase activating enzyme